MSKPKPYRPRKLIVELELECDESVAEVRQYFKDTLTEICDRVVQIHVNVTDRGAGSRDVIASEDA